MRRALAPLVVAALLLGATRARADATTEADALFDEGLKAMDAGDHAAACAKFGESQRLDPSIGTQFNLGLCNAALGRTASAWTSFVAAADGAAKKREAERYTAARKRALELEPRLVRLRLVVAEPPEGLVVTRDGAPIPPAQWNVAVPIDPGPHVMTASAPGRRRWSRTMTIGEEGTTLSIDVPALPVADTDDPSAENELPPGLATRERRPPPPAPPPPPPNRWIRPARNGAAALGGVALGVGTGFAIHSLVERGDARPHCDATTCDAEGLSANDDAIRSGNFATGFFVAGGAFLATAVVLWLVEPTRKTALTGVVAW